MAKADKGARLPDLSLPMQEAWRLYDAGDKLRARQQAEQVLAGAPSALDAAQARELLARTAPPRAALLFAGVALAVIVALVTLASLRG